MKQLPVGDVVGTIDSSVSKPKNLNQEVKTKVEDSNNTKSATTSKTSKSTISKPNSATEASRSDLQNLSPAVRHEVLSKNIDIDSVKGSGKAGRVLKEDLNDKPKLSVEPKQKSSERKVIKPMSSIRKTIATRLKKCPTNCCNTYYLQ